MIGNSETQNFQSLETTGAARPARAWPRRFVLILLALVPPLLYFATMMRTIGLPDSAILIDEMAGPVISSHVNNHNLNNLVGFFFQHLPVGDIVFRSNLVSVFYGTIALWIFFALLRTLRVPEFTALLTTFVLMVSHSFWWHSTQAESYTLSAAFLCACLLLVARDAEYCAAGRRATFHLPLACFLAGLSVFNHVQNGMLSVALVVYALYDVRRFFDRRGALLVRCFWTYILGALPYIIIVAVDLARSDDKKETLAWITGGGFRQLMFSYSSSRAFGDFGDWVFMQFPSPFLIFIPIGMFVLARSKGRRSFFIFAATVFAVNTIFFMGYKTWDQFAFYLPSFVCLALAGGVGAATIGSPKSHVLRPKSTIQRGVVLIFLGINVILPPLVYVSIPRWTAEKGGYWHGRFGAAQEAYRTRYDLAGMYADPIGHDRCTIENFARSIMDRLPRNARLIDDVSIYYQLEFLRTQSGARPDLRLELIRPMNMAGWGTEGRDIVSAAMLATNRIFIVATNGPCAEVVAAFNKHGRQARRLNLADGRAVYELVPAAQDR